MYIHIQTLAQLSEQEIRALNPNVSLPAAFVPPADFAYIFPTPQPAHDPVTQAVQATTPELTVLDHWEQRWTVIELYANQEDKDAAIAADTEAKRLAAVPQVVTMRQARLALLGAGLLPGVAAAINALSSPQKEAAQIEWEYSQTVERNRSFVLLLGAALGLTELQLDNLFTAAAAL